MKKSIANLMIFMFCVTNIVWTMPSVSAEGEYVTDVAPIFSHSYENETIDTGDVLVKTADANPTRAGWRMSSAGGEVNFNIMPRYTNAPVSAGNIKTLRLKRSAGTNVQLTRNLDSVINAVTESADKQNYKIVVEMAVAAEYGGTNGMERGTGSREYTVGLAKSSTLSSPFSATVFRGDGTNATLAPIPSPRVLQIRTVSASTRVAMLDYSGTSGNVEGTPSSLYAVGLDVFNIKLEAVLKENNTTVNQIRTYINGERTASNVTLTPTDGIDVAYIQLPGAGTLCYIQSMTVTKVYDVLKSSVDKTELQGAIDDAKAKLEATKTDPGIGGEIGEYSPLTLDNFNKDIAAAEAVYGDDNVGPTAVKNAKEALESKTAAFQTAANTTAIPKGGKLLAADFESGGFEGFDNLDATPATPIPVVTDIPTIGTYLQMVRNTFATFAPTRIYNPVEDTTYPVVNWDTMPSTFEVEGPNTTVITEFDAMVDTLGETEIVRYVLYPEQSVKDLGGKIAVTQIQFNGTKGNIEHLPTGSSNNAETLVSKFVPGHWYRIRVEIAITDANSEIDTQDGRVKIYVYDGENIYTNTDRRLYNSIKNRTYNLGQLEVGFSAQGSVGRKGYLDNVSVYKQNAVSINAPLKRGELVTLIRKAYSKISGAAVGTGETNYSQEEYDLFETAIGDALELYETPDAETTQAAIDTMSAELRDAIDDFKTNLTLDEIEFTDGSGQELTPTDSLAGVDELNISLPVTVNKNGVSATLVAVLYRANGDVHEIQAIRADNTDGVSAGGSKNLTVSFTLAEYDDLEDVNRENMYVKVFVWRDFDSLVPITSLNMVGRTNS